MKGAFLCERAPNINLRDWLGDVKAAKCKVGSEKCDDCKHEPVPLVEKAGDHFLGSGRIGNSKKSLKNKEAAEN